MNNKVILHIGLHKTATKYFQHFVFPNLPKEKFIYNPKDLDQYFLDYIKADEMDKHKVLVKFTNEKKTLMEKYPDHTLLISRESLSGNLFTAYRQWFESTKVLYELFPEAHIIISLRFQVDWLISCYRESLHEHHYQSIEKFICFNNVSNTFYKPNHDRNEEGYANLYALNLDYSQILSRLFELYGKDYVSSLFYEDFKSNKHMFLEKVYSILDISEIPLTPTRGIPNRGYSSFAIKLSILRAKILKSIGLDRIVHRPIFFFGEGSIPFGNPSLSILDKKKYWGDEFLKDNEEVRTPNYPNLTFKEKLKRALSWRYFVKNRLDRLIYIDKPLLAGDLRCKLESEYKTINCDLLELFSRDEIPNNYL